MTARPLLRHSVLLSRKCGRSGAGLLWALVCASLLFASCREKQSPSVVYTDAQRLQLDTTNNHTKNIDSLMHFVVKYRQEGDRGREMASLAALGHGYQTASRYADAVKAHQQQLDIAEQLDDTLMKASALNDLGVNYRRLGLYYDGLDYHLRAVETSLLYPDDKVGEKMLKCRAIGYNGAGNVYLSIGNYRKADEMLRKALAVETKLNSHLGMNVDLSNIGIVYERRGMIDSAWIYYERSMIHSELADSYTGKAYGYMNFGRLHALKGDYKSAIEEYHRSMSLVHSDRDLWLWMQPALALAEAYVDAGMADSARHQLEKAQSTAHSIGAKEYLPKIDRLYAKLCEKEGDCHEALMLYRRAEAREDSLLNARNLFEIETLQSDIADRHRAKIDERKEVELQRERWIKRILLLGLFIASMLLVSLLYVQRLRRRSHQALKQMSALRENFFTNITHEFRTPLTVILGLSRDLQNLADCPTEVGEKMRTIERQGNGLLTLINQLLDISKIKSSVGNPDWRNGDIAAYLTMIAESYLDFARSRNIDLQFFAKGEVKMDFVPDYVVKVMNNLLSNAFKFTPEYGKVSVSVWREGERLLVDVSDTGKGMDSESLSHIFEAFYQGGSDAHNIGTGVGLALVKQIMDAMEGKITAESTPGKGTTFHVSLPIRNQCKQQIVAGTEINKPLLPEASSTPQDSEGEDNACRLLIIEDNRDIAAYIGEQFADRYAVTYATNGTEGLEKALELVPDLIVTDLMMPGMDELEVCRQARNNEIINHIPIIIVTAKISEKDRIKGIEAGADAYLAKPFNSDELHTWVEQLLDRHRRLLSKFVGQAEEKPEEENQLTDVERRFLTKTVDLIYLLLDKRALEVNVLAEKLCMSPRQFHRKIVALTGNSPASYILKIKMQRARHLLDSEHELMIEDVADRCGFEHVSSFYHAFKKMYSVTPTEYRKSL